MTTQHPDHRPITPTTPTAPLGPTVLGYPRIGPRRELKRALEAYWSGRADRAELERTAAELRVRSWRRLKDLGLASVPSNTFSMYDQVLDAAVLVDAVPARHRAAASEQNEQDEQDGGLATYFAMARGAEGVAPLEMTKWFDTNYHYLVPEIGPDITFRLAGDKPVAEFLEARDAGVETRPVLLGPVSFLLLAKAAGGAGRPLDRLPDLLPVYEQLLAALHEAGAPWVQLDEPAFAKDRDDAELAALATAYERLGRSTARPAMFVATYFGDLGPALPVLAAAPVEAIGLDLVAGGRPELPAALRSKIVVAGVVDGRNVWRADLDAALDRLDGLREYAAGVAVSTSCSLLHVPYDVDAEEAMDERVRALLAFADQKVAEVVTLSRAFGEGRDAVAEELAASGARRDRRNVPGMHDDAVRARAAAVQTRDAERVPYDQRVKAQRERLDLPDLPVTTIGSFPQTAEVRRARADHRAGRSDRGEYTARMRAEIDRAVGLQEEVGVDVVVHGEAERADMVEYFAEQLDGFVTSTGGWVQSYGSRCVRPPILVGDVRRPTPMTVDWWRYAQSLTELPVKGMLTGPVTILAWSFVRDDQPLADTARQLALVVRDEVADLEAAGAAIVQVDEPALRELLPLRADAQPAYLAWAVGAFRLATAGASAATQVHTHLCYSDFDEVFASIDALDADVTSIEAARSGLGILDTIGRSGFARGIGPGVYDIHSPRVPAEDEVAGWLRAAVQVVSPDRLWVNPDCGLKTRGYPEVASALANVVAAARRLREELSR